MSYGLAGYGQRMKQDGLAGLQKVADLENRREVANDNMKSAKKTGQISGAASGAAIGMMAGMQAGSVGGPWGAAIGAVAGGLLASL